MARARVRCLPVVDEDGTLLGIVTKGDLLKPYLRTDAEIRRDIEDGIVAELLMLEPFTVEVEVEEGIVTLSGFVSQPVVADQLRKAVRKVPGVIDVDDSLRVPAAGERH
jgi:osmotically-inducible protein OsmY